MNLRNVIRFKMLASYSAQQSKDILDSFYFSCNLYMGYKWRQNKTEYNGDVNSFGRNT